MKSEDMILKAAIVHILDSSVGIPVLSDQSMEVGPDFSDFLKAHIEKITESDDVKHCTFAEGSEVKELLQNCTPDNFVETSKQLAERLYDIMNANIDIPAADVAMTVFGCKGKDYLAFLKMNYKTSYTHQTRETDGGNSNEIILQRALLPGQGQRLSEAFVLDLSDGSLILAEKKYEVNGEKCFYFSELFLECRAPLSQKSKLDIVTRAVDQVAKKYYGDEDAQKKMEIKDIICNELEEQGEIKVSELREKVFPGSPEMLEELDEKLDRYNLSYETVAPKNEQTIKKFQKQKLYTDTGIEITIPMEEYRNPDHVEFITNMDGTARVHPHTDEKHPQNCSCGRMRRRSGALLYRAPSPTTEPHRFRARAASERYLRDGKAGRTRRQNDRIKQSCPHSVPRLGKTIHFSHIRAV